MKVQVSEIEAGQHIWMRGELWLVESVDRSEFSGRYTIRRSNGDIAILAADAMVQVH